MSQSHDWICFDFQRSLVCPPGGDQEGEELLSSGLARGLCTFRGTVSYKEGEVSRVGAALFHGLCDTHPEQSTYCMLFVPPPPPPPPGGRREKLPSCRWVGFLTAHAPRAVAVDTCLPCGEGGRESWPGHRPGIGIVRMGI